MELTDNLGAQGDDFYEALLAAHAELKDTESHALNVRLVLMLANEVGDVARLKSLLREARDLA